MEQNSPAVQGPLDGGVRRPVPTRDYVGMSTQYTTNGKRKSSMTHARRTYTCVCGKACRGNGGWSSHKAACQQWKAARTARAPNVTELSRAAEGRLA